MAAVIVKCNKNNCRFYQSLQCSLDTIIITGRRCASYRARQEENYESLMQTQRTNCCRDKGKYVSSHVTRVLK